MDNKMRETDLKILTSIGLSKSEAIIYIDLVRNASSSVIDIARRIGVHRPNVYDSLRRLKERGLVVEVINSGGKMFKALDPEKLHLYLKQKESKVLGLIEELKNIPKKEAQSSKGALAIAEGIAVKKELMTLFDSGEEILVGLNSGLDYLSNDFFRDLNQERIAKQINMKLLAINIDPERVKNLNETPFTEARIIDKGLSEKFITIVVGDVLYYLFFKDGLTMIKIQQKDLAEDKKINFNLAWERAKVV